MTYTAVQEVNIESLIYVAAAWGSCVWHLELWLYSGLNFIPVLKKTWKLCYGWCFLCNGSTLRGYDEPFFFLLTPCLPFCNVKLFKNWDMGEDGSEAIKSEMRGMFLCYWFLSSPQRESVMIRLYRQPDYLHHSSAQWKPWELLACLPKTHHIHGRENRVMAVQKWLHVVFSHKGGMMMMMHFYILIISQDEKVHTSCCWLLSNISLYPLNCLICGSCVIPVIRLQNSVSCTPVALI